MVDRDANCRVATLAPRNEAAKPPRRDRRVERTSHAPLQCERPPGRHEGRRDRTITTHAASHGRVAGSSARPLAESPCGRRAAAVCARGALAAPWYRWHTLRELHRAEWMCPINCIEPPRCPATKDTRTWSLPPALAQYAADERVANRAVEGPYAPVGDVEGGAATLARGGERSRAPSGAPSRWRRCSTRRRRLALAKGDDDAAARRLHRGGGARRRHRHDLDPGVRAALARGPSPPAAARPGARRTSSYAAASAGGARVTVAYRPGRTPPARGWPACGRTWVTRRRAGLGARPAAAAGRRPWPRRTPQQPRGSI